MMRSRTDHVDSRTRSAIMRAVKNRRVKSTELALRARLVAAGIRGWRMYSKALPGTPDFVFAANKVAVFVHGCFWHGCPRCYRRPHSSRRYWDAKVAGNRARDLRVVAQLRRRGWKVIRFWECDLVAKSDSAIVSRIRAAVHRQER
jgi:DNA mismatch endonuclease (patch repair protein)